MNNRALKISAGAAISAFCLWFVFRGFDFRELRSALRTLHWGWLAAGAAMVALNAVLRTLRWQVILTPIRRIPFSTLFPVFCFGMFMNNILPARGGEFVRAAGAKRATGIEASFFLGSIVVERISDLLGLIMLMLFASRLLPWEKLPVAPVAITMGAGLTCLAALIYAARKAKPRIEHIEGIKGKVFRFLLHMINGFAALRSYRRMAVVVAITLAVWTIEALSALFVSHALNLGLDFFQSTAMVTGICVGVMIPGAPGYVGTYEFFGKQALMFLGFPAAQALTAVLMLHFTAICVYSAFGITSLLVLSLRGRETGPALEPRAKPC